ncbi:hypothetical protein [Halalkalibacterium ligniniphilum]|uniref:hypothetical protein n=1 Tax=Halalkalibacterium ligniniphilum TaxID=1134413 RepID=UPI000344CD40|nr:hypothetical protein [Halalkalibacterium ligniniphilum]
MEQSIDLYLLLDKALEGTSDPEGVVQEVLENQYKIEALMGELGVVGKLQKQCFILDNPALIHE